LDRPSDSTTPLSRQKAVIPIPRPELQPALRARGNTGRKKL
jgi:hypothetical protein